VTLGQFVALALTGLSSAAILFLVSVGLSLVFGVTRIVNFAHGGFYMIGAYVAFSLADRFAEGSAAAYWLCVVAAALAVALIGLVVEVLLLRRMYQAPELFQLLATFGVALMIDDLLLMIYGPQDLLAPRIRGLRGGVELLGQRFPVYDVYVILIAPIVLALLWFLLRRTRWGTLVRAATLDRDMVGALGVNQAWLFTSVFTLGAFLAGLAGAVQLERAAVNLGMGANAIVEAFVVVVIGGMGSIVGALLAAILIGEIQAFGVAFFPHLTLILTFLVMAIVLAVRPWGLLGRPEAMTRPHDLANEPPLRALRPGAVATALIVLAAFAAAPAFLGVYGLGVLVDMLVLILFAGSLFLITGPGGLVSFGHACYFGIGAYAAALSVHYWGLSFWPALALAPVAAGIAALVFGWLCVRVSGVYFAMLTFAFAQIVWSVVFQWYGFTGGDNGIVGIWPDAVGGRLAFYYVVLAVTALGVAILAALLHTPFVYALRLGRDSPARAAAIGIDVRRQQWLAFGVAGLFAGIAGGLFTFAKGSVFPTAISVDRSIDALVMVLFGGVQSIAGAVVGALGFFGLKSEILRYTDSWRLALGTLIILIVLAFPKGIVGSLASYLRWGDER
jgi:branched-chain amino acid transport system permease protein